MYQSTYSPYENTEVEYTFSPGEPMTFDDPGCPPEIEFGSIVINGEPAGEDLEEILFEACGDVWEEKILENIAQAKIDYEEEQAEFFLDKHRARIKGVA